MTSRDYHATTYFKALRYHLDFSFQFLGCVFVPVDVQNYENSLERIVFGEEIARSLPGFRKCSRIQGDN